jgi:hypothetical protein
MLDISYICERLSNEDHIHTSYCSTLRFHIILTLPVVSPDSNGSTPKSIDYSASNKYSEYISRVIGDWRGNRIMGSRLDYR